MAYIHNYVFLIAVGIAASAVASFNETIDVEFGPKPLRDRFRMILNNINEQRKQDEIEDFTSYGCERMVVIRNKAQDKFKLECSSYHDTPKPTVIELGNSYAFTFKPLKDGRSTYWCSIEYKQQFARFDVYNEDLSYMCPRSIEEVYQYTVHHDGVYVDKKGENSEKIRSLMKGHNKFILWQEFVNGETDGFLLSGLVDGGNCYDIPKQFNDKAAAVTVCYNHCVHLWEHYGCKGRMQTVQASDFCKDTGLINELGGRLSSIQGC